MKKSTFLHFLKSNSARKTIPRESIQTSIPLRAKCCFLVKGEESFKEDLESNNLIFVELTRSVFEKI